MLPQIVTIVLVLSLGYAFTYEIMVPNLQNKKNEIEDTSANYYDAFKKLPGTLARKDYKNSSRLVQILKSIDIKNPEISKFADDVARLKIEQDTEPALVVQETIKTTLSLANDFFLRGQEFEAKGDWYSAHYYFSRSFSLDPSRKDAQRRAAENEARIASLGVNAKEKKERAFAARKIEGYQALMSDDYLKAYSVFMELAKTGETDLEVDRYLKESGEALKTAAFYIDELEMGLAGNHESSLLFSSPMGQSASLFLAAKSAAISDQNVYFENIELLLVDGNLKVASASAPFAKLHTSPATEKTPERNILYLRSVDRENPALVTDPEIEGIFSQAFSNILTVNFNAKDVRLAALSRKHTAELSIFDIGAAIKNAKKLGLGTGNLELEQMERIIVPFAFSCLLLLAIPVGWMLRSNYSTGLPFAIKLGIPLLAVAMVPITEFWFRTNRVLSLFLRNLFPADFFIVGLIVFYGILIALILLFTAGRRDSEIIH